VKRIRDIVCATGLMLLYFAGCIWAELKRAKW